MVASFIASYRFFAKDILLQHTFFALPFALSSLSLADIPGVSVGEFALLLVCMFCARSFAMGMNRYLDRKIDQANPRTRHRAIPTGQLTPQESLWWCGMHGLGFVAGAFGLNPLAGYLAPCVLCILAGYSLQKRWTILCHLYLGLCLGLAPVGVCLALNGQHPLPAVLVGLSVMLWTCGFDILYATQDRAFDQAFGLKSIPARYTLGTAVWISRVCFGGMLLCLAGVGWVAHLGSFYWMGVFLCASLLMYEQWLVRDLAIKGKSEGLNQAFFHMNAWISVIFYIMLLADRWAASLAG